MYPVCFSKTGQPLNFRLCDTRGLEDCQGIDGNDVSYLLDGNLPDGFQVVEDCLPICWERNSICQSFQSLTDVYVVYPNWKSNN